MDNKYRYKFLSWKDEEFIEDLNWLIKELENIKKINSKLLSQAKLGEFPFCNHTF